MVVSVVEDVVAVVGVMEDVDVVGRCCCRLLCCIWSRHRSGLDFSFDSCNVNQR